MPKNEPDPQDPLELNGVALPSSEDTLDAMAECFVEEFLRMGYGPDEVLALFRNPAYFGSHLVLRTRGEPFVRGLIVDIFARSGRSAKLTDAPAPGIPLGRSSPSPEPACAAGTAISTPTTGPGAPDERA